MPARDVNAYVKRNKNDAADAEAIVPHCFSHGALASRQRTLIGSMSLRVGIANGVEVNMPNGGRFGSEYWREYPVKHT